MVFAAPVFDEKRFKEIFLDGKSPNLAKGKQQLKKGDIVEHWGLFPEKLKIAPLDALRQFRKLWGIQANLDIGWRNEKRENIRARAKVDGVEYYLETYSGNVKSALEDIVRISPYSEVEKKSALGHKKFARLIFAVTSKDPLARIRAVIVAYSIMNLLTEGAWYGCVHIDHFLFLPPASLDAGIKLYQAQEAQLMARFVSGFNFFKSENGEVYFFTHGNNFFAVPDAILKAHESGEYMTALGIVHTFFLQAISKKETKGITVNDKKIKVQALPSKLKLPEQVSAMMGKQKVWLQHD